MQALAVHSCHALKDMGIWRIALRANTELVANLLCRGACMQYVNAEEIVMNLSGPMRRALAQAVAEVIPDQECDEALLYKAFVKAVRKQCGTWVTVPDKCVRD
ncbi:MAG TPA: hypothetical protein VIF60_02745 [Burkholderiaceae bacterium]